MRKNETNFLPNDCADSCHIFAHDDGFRNEAVAPSATFTPSHTPTNTLTATTGTATSMVALTSTPVTPTPVSCEPTVVMPSFAHIPIGGLVEGLGRVDPRLNIDAKNTAIDVLQGIDPSVYRSLVDGDPVISAGMVAGGGFSDYITKSNFDAHLYTVTFAPGVTISNFLLHMLDFGDFNPSGNPSHIVTMTAYDASNVAVSSQQLNYTTVGSISPVYGDAINAAPQSGNWTWNCTSCPGVWYRFRSEHRIRSTQLQPRLPMSDPQSPANTRILIDETNSIVCIV